MIPEFVDIGAPWPVLPPGLHLASLQEIQTRYAFNSIRLELFNGFEHACGDLVKANCSLIYLDGSFVTAKEYPGDFDACWDPRGMDPVLVDPTLLDFTDERRAQKKKYKGELFPSTAIADNAAGTIFLDFFRDDRFTGKPKGIIQVIL